MAPRLYGRVGVAVWGICGVGITSPTKSTELELRVAVKGERLSEWGWGDGGMGGGGEKEENGEGRSFC